MVPTGWTERGGWFHHGLKGYEFFVYTLHLWYMYSSLREVVCLVEGGCVGWGEGGRGEKRDRKGSVILICHCLHLCLQICQSSHQE